LLIDRVRRRRGLLVAMYVACALTAAHYVLILSSPLLAVQLVGYAGRGAMAALGTLITVALTDWCPRSQVAGGVALLATAAGVAAIIFPPLGGWLYSIDPRAPFAMAVVVIGGAQFLVWRTFRARREDAIPSVVAV
jgi:MFS family permease